ncbi:MAG: thioredoxin-disulfide reductase [Desulfobulbaceae bacterium]|jgi:thioredoxin reductase (NADPH)|nr:thioredoxin-disulfide reductase [Desulfobulbaceae bacterium]MDY0350630.1 thioredoxin-disulfide reductase [Desulfobulbaceae bacterium]
MDKADYQLVIIGGGPAGLTAGLYAARARLNTVLVEKTTLGGQVLITHWVDNYPGVVDGAAGYDLIEKWTAHARRFGLETRSANVVSLDLKNSIKILNLENGDRITARAVIICTGGSPGKLNVPGEKEFTGKGVSYCATCDGPFYKGREIAVVGGGNTAIQEAVHLTRFAAKVTVIHRRGELRATKVVQEKAFADERIEFILNAEVEEIRGGPDGVEELRLRHRDGSVSSLAVTGVFILIGVVPNNEILPRDALELDEYGFIITDTEMRTALPGVFAAGDIRSKNFRQIVTAAGEGATAELSAEHYLANMDEQ